MQTHRHTRSNDTQKRVQVEVYQSKLDKIWCHFGLSLSIFVCVWGILDCYWPCRQKMNKSQHSTDESRREYSGWEKKLKLISFSATNSLVVWINFSSSMDTMYANQWMPWLNVVSSSCAQKVCDSLLANECMKAINNCKLTDFRLSLTEFRRCSRWTERLLCLLGARWRCFEIGNATASGRKNIALLKPFFFWRIESKHEKNCSFDNWIEPKF